MSPDLTSISSINHSDSTTGMAAEIRQEPGYIRPVWSTDVNLDVFTSIEDPLVDGYNVYIRPSGLTSVLDDLEGGAVDVIVDLLSGSVDIPESVLEGLVEGSLADPSDIEGELDTVFEWGDEIPESRPRSDANGNVTIDGFPTLRVPIVGGVSESEAYDELLSAVGVVDVEVAAEPFGLAAGVVSDPKVIDLELHPGVFIEFEEVDLATGDCLSLDMIDPPSGLDPVDPADVFEFTVEVVNSCDIPVDDGELRLPGGQTVPVGEVGPQSSLDVAEEVSPADVVDIGSLDPGDVFDFEVELVGYDTVTESITVADAGPPLLIITDIDYPSEVDPADLAEFGVPDPTVTVTIENQGGQSIGTSIGVDPGDATLVSLEPGESTTIELTPELPSPGEVGSFEVETPDDSESFSIELLEGVPELSILDIDFPDVLEPDGVPSVDVEVQNEGTAAAEEAVSLGTDSIPVSLDPGESTTVSFNPTPPQPGDSISHTVSFGGETETFEISMEEPPEPTAIFELVGLDAPSFVEIGEQPTVDVEVANVGDAMGDANISLPGASETLSIPAGETRSVSMPIDPPTPGSVEEYVLEAGGSTRQFVVEMDEVDLGQYPVEISVLVENVGGAGGFPDVAVAGTSASGPEVPPGETEWVTVEVPPPRPGEAAEYDIDTGEDSDSFVLEMLDLPSPAEFLIRDVSLPEFFAPDEDPEIDVEVENVGDVGGETDVSGLGDSVSVQLPAGGTETVTLTVTPPEPGGSQTFVVETDDDSESVTLETPDPATFIITSIDAPDIRDIDTPPEIDVGVENVGEWPGEAEVSIPNDSADVSLDAGEWTSVTLTPEPPEPGEEQSYAVEVGDDSDEVSIESPPPAEFIIAGIDAPDIIGLDEAPEIGVLVENVGGWPGEGEVSAPGDSASFSLDGGESTTVPLSVDMPAPGEIQTYTVETGDDSDEFELEAEPNPPEFELVDVTAPGSVTIGDTAPVTATVENVGGDVGDVRVDVGNVSSALSGVEPGGRRNVTVEPAPDTAGSRSFDVSVVNLQTGADDDTGSVSVSVEELPTPDPPEMPTPEPPEVPDPEPPGDISPPGDGEEEYDGPLTYLDPLGVFGTSRQFPALDDILGRR